MFNYIFQVRGFRGGYSYFCGEDYFLKYFQINLDFYSGIFRCLQGIWGRGRIRILSVMGEIWLVGGRIKILVFQFRVRFLFCQIRLFFKRLVVVLFGQFLSLLNVGRFGDFWGQVLYLRVNYRIVEFQAVTRSNLGIFVFQLVVVFQESQSSIFVFFCNGYKMVQRVILVFFLVKMLLDWLVYE